MSRREKLRQKLRNRAADSNMQDVQTVLRQFGFVYVRARGSHYIFEYDDGENWRQIVVPVHGRKVKKVYVKQIVETLDELFPEEEGDDNENT